MKTFGPIVNCIMIGYFMFTFRRLLKTFRNEMISTEERRKNERKRRRWILRLYTDLHLIGKKLIFHWSFSFRGGVPTTLSFPSFSDLQLLQPFDGEVRSSRVEIFVLFLFMDKPTPWITPKTTYD